MLKTFFFLKKKKSNALNCIVGNESFICLVRSKCLELPNWSRNFYCQNDLKLLSNFHYLKLSIKKHTIIVNTYFNESASTKGYLQVKFLH